MASGQMALVSRAEKSFLVARESGWTWQGGCGTILLERGKDPRRQERKMKWDSVEAQRLAEVALAMWAGQDNDEGYFSAQEWERGTDFGDDVQEAVARFIARCVNEGHDWRND
jgi:hypothetical protein